VYSNVGLPRPPPHRTHPTPKVYLESLVPLTTAAELARATAHVERFLAPGGQGAELQRRLERRAAECNAGGSSWLQAWWNTGSYLDYREPVVVFVSYFFHFGDLPAGFRGPGTQVARAAALLHGALTFRQKVVLGEDLGRGKVCHTPLKYMYNSCRVPLVGRDHSVVYPVGPAAAAAAAAVAAAAENATEDATENNHVIVICGHQFFSFRATRGAEGRWAPFSLADLTAQLRRVRDAAAVGTAQGAPAVGAFTGAHRDSWAAARQQLVADGHTAFLDAVQSAILVVCLDASAPSTRDEVARALWHGNGDARNRWYDKTHQIVVFANGKAGMVGEHSQFDGLPSVSAADFMLQHERAVIKEGASAESSTSSSGAWPWRSSTSHSNALPGVRHLSLELLQRGVWSAESEWNLTNAQREMGDLAARHDVSTLSFRLGGKKMIKSFKMSPDAFAQMAIQLAYYRKFGTQRATYEPFSMSAYRHGRTETVRVVSSESKTFVEAMCDRSSSNSERLVALRAAASQHIKYIKTAARGDACDRHLWGLRKCIREGEDLPGIFTDPTYWRTCTWHISTSNLSNDLFDGWGWGEVVPDGLGIAYSTNSEVLLFNVASCRGWSGDMCARIEQALLDMCNMCIAGSSKA
jgi:carnitine O-acetyltransferase